MATIYAGTLAYNVLGPKHGWLAPFARHDRYGHIGIANAGGFHWSHPEFLVEYHFDDHGWRRSPEPREPVRGTIVFLGCSYTFGIGVEDDEVYVARLAERWPHYRVLNHSFPGWASTESLVVLEDDLKAHPTPKAVLYGWIDDHQRRNWLRRSWHKNKLAWGGLIQFYELEDGRLVHRGLIDPARATAEDTPETTAIEEQLSLALLKRMHDICNERGTAFYFVAFNQWYSGKSRVPQMVREAGIPTIDATALSTDFFPNDTHPTPAWHRAVAERIAGDPRLKAFRE